MDEVPLAEPGAFWSSWSDEEVEDASNGSEAPRKKRRATGARRRAAKSAAVPNASQTPGCAASVPATPTLTRAKRGRDKAPAVAAPTPATAPKAAPSPPPIDASTRVGVSSRARKMLELVGKATGASLLERLDKEAEPEPSTPIKRRREEVASPQKLAATTPQKPAAATPQKQAAAAASGGSVTPDSKPSAGAPSRGTPGPAMPLPGRLRGLLEQAAALDTALNLSRARRDVLALDRLAPAVQSVTRRAFGERQLGQLLTALPGAYDVRLVHTGGDAATRAGLGGFGARFRTVVDFPPSEFAPADGGPTPAVAPPGRLLGELQLSARRRAVRRALEELVHASHEAFLASRAVSVERAAVRAWHPDFDLESVPEIVPAELPKPPRPGPSPVELLERTQGKAKAAADEGGPPAVANVPGTAAMGRRSAPTGAAPRAGSHPNVAEEALKSVLAKRAAEAAAATAAAEAEAAAAAARRAGAGDGELRGVSAAIIARVRERERRAALERITGVPEERERGLLACKLPGLAAVLRSYLNTETAPCMLLDPLAARLARQHREPAEPRDVRKQLEALAAAAPEWLQIASTSSGPVLRVAPGADVSAAVARLSRPKRE